MSFKRRLIFAFSSMVLIVGFLGLFAASTVQILKSNYNEYERSKNVAENSVAITKKLQQIKASVDQMVLGIGLRGRNIPELQAQMNELLENWRILTEGPEEKREFDMFELRLKTLNSYFEQVVTLIKHGEKLAVLKKMDEVVLPELNRTTQFIQLLANSELNEADLLINRNRVMTDYARNIAWILFIATSLVGIGLAFQLYHSIAEPMDKLQEGIRKLGQGDWNLKFEHFEVQEMEALATTMETMAGNLKNLQAKVVQMDRMAAVGTLAGGVAHELNNPLTGVLGIAQMLVEKLDPQDKRRKMAEKIHESAARCQRIVHSLLSFSRQAEIQLDPVNINDILNQSLSFCQPDMHSRNIRLDWEQDNLIPQVLASSHHIQQVFLNLITNAMDAMHGGGDLNVSTKYIPLINIKESRENFPFGGVAVTFKDSGVGIAPEHISKVFEPFFTTKEVGKGTGLGLSVSYSIIKKHKGTIDVRSEGPGKGTAFTVTLPVAQDDDMKFLNEQTRKLVEATPAPEESEDTRYRQNT